MQIQVASSALPEATFENGPDASNPGTPSRILSPSPLPDDGSESGTGPSCRQTAPPSQIRPAEPSIQPDPVEQGGPNTGTHLPSFQVTESFLEALRNATLENSGMELADIARLCKPRPNSIDLLDSSNRHLLKSIRHFLNNADASRDHYENTRRIDMLTYPDDPFLSFNQVKKCVESLSGVVPIRHDMCLNSCLAFTGPYAELDTCPICSTRRHDPKTNKPYRHFTTIPIGPVIQSFYGSELTAERMHYLERRLTELSDYAKTNGQLPKYDDTACSKDLLDAWEARRFTKDDIALQLSIDGAQLFQDKESNCWFFIWIIHNLPPDLRYKKAFVIPGAIVPGPNKPKELDSYLFPSLYHVAALQHEGLKIWDAFLKHEIPRSIPEIIFATADGPGSAAMSGQVGHSGKYGCRLYCEMPSRRRDGDGHYFPVMKKPRNYNVQGASHPDIHISDLAQFRRNVSQRYHSNLRYLMNAPNKTQYKVRRLQTGLCKQTLLSGLPSQAIGVPKIFTMDIMHLSVLNDPDLLLGLW